MALIGGFEPPRRGPQFTWCELGCGLGVTAVVYGAVNPEATFLGIDAMPRHVGFARQLADAAGAHNVSFHALDFEAALDLDLPPLDYVVAHGVYSWVDEAAQAALHRFVDRHLAPGGIVYLSYNAMPGWAADAPFQHLVRALASDRPGDSNERFASAAAVVHGLTGAGAPALAASEIAAGWERYEQSRDRSYFAHEFLPPGWRALYVDQVRAAMAGLGLVPVGSATLTDNFDSLVLKRSARDALRAIADDDRRELARDYFLAQRFRRDVFARNPRAMTAAERRDRLLRARFALLRPPSLVEFTLTTEAGQVRFDNPVAHRLVAALASGPRRLVDCLEDGDDGRDVLANALTLCCARVLWPATPAPVGVERLNNALLDAAGEEAPLAYHALPCGTALRFSRTFLEALRGGAALAEDAEAWAAHLRACGATPRTSHAG